MAFAKHGDVELIEFPENEGNCDSIADKSKSRRRRRRGKKSKADTVTDLKCEQSLMSAAEILSRAAKAETIESSPSSVISEPSGRKLSALDLDKIVEGEEVTCTTGTPGSLDSSRSLWELGTIGDEEMDLLFPTSDGGARRPSMSFSSRILSPPHTPTNPSYVSDITSGIDSILSTLPKSLTGSTAEIRRLCLPSSNNPGSRNRSNRLCIDNVPRVDITPLADFFGSVSSSMADVMDRITGALAESTWAQPEGVVRILGSLPSTKSKSSGIPNSSIPLVNRKQRRAVEFARDSPLRSQHS
jgi:hypothetical protein